MSVYIGLPGRLSGCTGIYRGALLPIGAQGSLYRGARAGPGPGACLPRGGGAYGGHKSLRGGGARGWGVRRVSGVPGPPGHREDVPPGAVSPPDRSGTGRDRGRGAVGGCRGCGWGCGCGRGRSPGGGGRRGGPGTGRGRARPPAPASTSTTSTTRDRYGGTRGPPPPSQRWERARTGCPWGERVPPKK